MTEACSTPTDKEVKAAVQAYERVCPQGDMAWHLAMKSALQAAAKVRAEQGVG